MKFYEKFLILALAVCVSVLGFNLIASSSVCLLKAARESGYERIHSYLAKCVADSFSDESIAKKPFQHTPARECLQLAHLISSFSKEKIDNFSRKTKNR